MVEIKPLDLTAAKLDKLAEVLSSDSRYFSDEDRNQMVAWRTLHHWFGEREPVAAYEIGDMNAVLVFHDIVPGLKCRADLIGLAPTKAGVEDYREGMKVVREVMAAFKLHKIEVCTVLPKIARLLSRLGFRCEGVKKDSYLMNGAYRHNILMALMEG